MAEMSKNAAKYKLVLTREEYRVHMLHTSFPAKVSELHIICWTTVMYTNIQRRNIGKDKGALIKASNDSVELLNKGVDFSAQQKKNPGNGHFTVHTCVTQLM